MKRATVVLSLLPSFVCCLSALAQGALNPPGVPAPTMRTLDQVEPRIPLAAGSPGVTANDNGGFTITQPGSYFLTRDLTVGSGNGINVNSSSVTIDLRGFTISSTANPAAGAAIQVPETQGIGNLAFYNGHIRGAVTRGGNNIYTGSGFQKGIGRLGVLPRSVRITDISIAGLSGSGIDLGFAPTDATAVAVDRCTVESVGGTGIVAGNVSNSSANGCGTGIIAPVVSNSRAYASVGRGIVAETATNCTASSNGGDGITAHTVSACTARLNGGVGIKGASVFFGFEGSAVGGTVTGSTAAANELGIYARVVSGCTATTNKTHGIRVTSLAKDNDASHNGDEGNGAGIYFTGVGVRIEGNNCYDNDWGIQSEPGADGFIVRNSARGNGGGGRPGPTNAGASSAYDFDRASNTYGPVRTVNGDLSGDALGSNPWANIQY